MTIKHDLVEEDDLLILALYKQDTEVTQPAFYFYPSHKKIMLQRNEHVRHFIDVSDEAIAVIRTYDEIMVTETDFFDPNDFVTYFLPIEIVNDQDLKLPDS